MLKKAKKHGDWLCGVRFEKSAPIRSGVDGTLVVDSKALSGPIVLLGDDGYWCARCSQCWGASPDYKRKSNGLWQWAHRHRCSNRHPDVPDTPGRAC